MKNCKKCIHLAVCAFRDPTEDEITCASFDDGTQHKKAVYGEWILVGRTNNRASILQCSNCGRVRRGHGRSKFCPDCGAEMLRR